MIQNAEMAAVHVLEWRDQNLDIQPEAKFYMLEEEEEKERERRKQSCCTSARKPRRWKIERSRVRNCGGRWMSSRKTRQHTYRTFGLRTGTSTDSNANRYL